jgi:hypothetical protein
MPDSTTGMRRDGSLSEQQAVSIRQQSGFARAKTMISTLRVYDGLPNR